MRPIPLLTLLRSVKEQSLYPNEILIIDASTNTETEQVLYKEKIENLIYLNVDQKDRGLTKQRNKGVSMVDDKSEVICFLDDDTILERDYFKNLLHTYSIYPEAIAVGGYIANEVSWERQTDP